MSALGLAVDPAALPAWAALAAALLLALGATIVLIGALGLLRLRTFYQRIHGPAIAVTLGAGSVLLASMVYFTASQSRPVVHELIIAAFLLATAPVVSMLVMRAAVYRDLRARKREAGATAGEVYTIPDEE
ncbi:cation:proton antiporter [Massilia forsythiae]|uniref:Cation:proton antiporter n=1 Tax=Massilia forsythiae TaxID=2728020 RepID=A0A7Z2W0W3_9BURK|nr:monovalent cation/H(+) antiporter subunit G [Massilia forsythiae]QJE02733.1 cation:proton antiporter [Massilia forsythiae]